MKKEQKICVSDIEIAFIKDYVFKQLNTTFYIDKKRLTAIYYLACCFEERVGKSYYFGNFYGFDRYIKYEADDVLFKQVRTFSNTIEKAKEKDKEIDLENLNTRLGTKKENNNEIIDKVYLKLLTFIYEIIDPQSEVFNDINGENCVAELSKDLDATIEYIDACGEKELALVSEQLEDLAEHFKSQELIDCVSRNITRFDDIQLQEQLKIELEYMQMYLK